MWPSIWNYKSYMKFEILNPRTAPAYLQFRSTFQQMWEHSLCPWSPRRSCHTERRHGFRSNQPFQHAALVSGPEMSSGEYYHYLYTTREFHSTMYSPGGPIGVYEPEGWGWREDKAIIFQANATFFGQNPATRNEKNCIVYAYGMSDPYHW